MPRSLLEPFKLSRPENPQQALPPWPELAVSCHLPQPLRDHFRGGPWPPWLPLGAVGELKEVGKSGKCSVSLEQLVGLEAPPGRGVCLATEARMRLSQDSPQQSLSLYTWREGGDHPQAMWRQEQQEPYHTPHIVTLGTCSCL